jgi:hypothetical protein
MKGWSQVLSMALLPPPRPSVSRLSDSPLVDSRMTFCRLTTLVVAVSLLACHKQASQSASDPPYVEYIPVQNRLVTLSTNQLLGRTSAYETSDVRPQVNGLVEVRLLTEGDLVRNRPAALSHRRLALRGVEDGPDVRCAWTTATLCCRNMQCHQRPLFVSQI